MIVSIFYLLYHHWMSKSPIWWWIIHKLWLRWKYPITINYVWGRKDFVGLIKCITYMYIRCRLVIIATEIRKGTSYLRCIQQQEYVFIVSKHRNSKQGVEDFTSRMVSGRSVQVCYTYSGAVSSFMTEEVHSVSSRELADITAVLFAGVVVWFEVFTCLPSELTDKVTGCTSEVWLIIDSYLLDVLILYRWVKSKWLSKIYSLRNYLAVKPRTSLI